MWHPASSLNAPAVVALLLVSGACSRVQESGSYLFRHPRDSGSDANYDPVSMVINSSYGILQYPNRPRKIFEIHYATGLKNVTFNVLHAFSAINHYGWKNFIGSEVFPRTSTRRMRSTGQITRIT